MYVYTECTSSLIVWVCLHVKNVLKWMHVQMNVLLFRYIKATQVNISAVFLRLNIPVNSHINYKKKKDLRFVFIRNAYISECFLVLIYKGNKNNHHSLFFSNRSVTPQISYRRKGSKIDLLCKKHPAHDIHILATKNKWHLHKLTCSMIRGFIVVACMWYVWFI